MKPLILKCIFRRISGLMLALVLIGSATSGVALAQENIEAQPSRRTLFAGEDGDASTPLPTYAYVLADNVQVYPHPLSATLGETAHGALRPVRSLGTGYLWVSLADDEPLILNGQAWYKINANEYVRAEDIAIYAPSKFQGAAFSSHPDKPFAWMVYSVRPSSVPGESPSGDAPWLTRYSLVTIYEEQIFGDWSWYRVGENQWIEQRNVGVVRPAHRPQGVGSGDKWIDVNLYEQTMAAYEGDRLVYATLISSGLPYWQTATGLFTMWGKVEMAKMSGREGYSDYYFLEDVPNAMYFFETFALHGAYWHDRFGFPHSHGCVNLAPRDAAWLFDWVTPVAGAANWTIAGENNPGTWVWVHD